MGRIVDKIKEVTGIKGKASQNQHFFPLRELQKATNQFDKGRIVGTGGFGDVYLGILKNGRRVAVKRNNPNSGQGKKEFQVETELLARLNHPSLVSLIGYCDEPGEMILVYEYMEEGTLKSHLYGSDKPSLNWEQRLVVSVGAAKGLHYLHTSSPEGIIHRDVKSDNILLDENFCAKVGDFGLLKLGPEPNKTHVSTQVKGTPGYLDREYWETQHLTMKSDVYSFGVVLLEVLCGRPVIERTPSGEMKNLVRWRKKMLEAGRVEEIVDQKISGTINPQYLTAFGDIVLKCLAEERADRPMMEEVLRDLERELEFLRASTRVPAANSDESYHDSISVATGNSDESDHATSSRYRNNRPWKRSEGKIFERTSSIPGHDLSTSLTSWRGRSRVPAGNTINGLVELYNIHENISEDGNSHELDHA